jgi:hypothetical protein
MIHSIFDFDVQEPIAKKSQPRMNTNIHECRLIKIKKEIRVHSCSFVAKISTAIC